MGTPCPTIFHWNCWLCSIVNILFLHPILGARPLLEIFKADFCLAGDSLSLALAHSAPHLNFGRGSAASDAHALHEVASECAGRWCHHLVLSAQYAADILPLAMFLLCLALNEARFCFAASDSPVLGFPAVLAPCSPNRMTFSLPLSQALTMWLFFGWDVVFCGLLHGMLAFLA